MIRNIVEEHTGCIRLKGKKVGSSTWQEEVREMFLEIFLKVGRDEPGRVGMRWQRSGRDGAQEAPSSCRSSLDPKVAEAVPAVRQEHVPIGMLMDTSSEIPAQTGVNRRETLLAQN